MFLQTEQLDHMNDIEPMLSSLTKMSIQHYILGRFAFCNAFFDTVGINTHRAFELLLKASIIKATQDKNVKKFGHSILDLYQKHCDLRIVDSAKRLKFIDALQAFEEMRYPDSLDGQAIQIQLASKVICGTVVKFGNPPMMNVVSNLHETDLVFKEIMEQASINPELVQLGLREDGKRALFNGNESFLDATITGSQY